MCVPVFPCDKELGEVWEYVCVVFCCCSWVVWPVLMLDGSCSSLLVSVWLWLSCSLRSVMLMFACGCGGSLMFFSFKLCESWVPT